MGQITSSIGLISGINTAQIIDQLIAIESRPKQIVQQQNAVFTTQQVAFQSINAKLLSLKLASSGFSTNKTFTDTTTTSSNESIATATSSSATVPGSYSFVVDRLVASQQLVTQGLSDLDSTPVSPTGGTLTFEFGSAELDSDTSLSQLNGGTGVQRGKIRITDRSGAAATVDLSKALTVNDVLDAINNTQGVSVKASVSGDRFVLTDNTGSSSSALKVQDLGTTTTAANLGLTAAAVGDTLTGSIVNTLGDATTLASLNDGNGVSRNGSQTDFSINDGLNTYNINLDAQKTLGDVLDAINTATSGAVTAAANSTGGITLTAGSGGPITVAALNGSQAADDLGLLGSSPTGSLTGRRVLASLNSRLIDNLNGGAGVTLGEVSVTGSLGNATVNLAAASSVQDLLDAFNNQSATTGVTASLNEARNGINLTDSAGGAITVSDLTGSAADDLNLAGAHTGVARSGNLQFRYISAQTSLASLNGGKGVSAGQFTLTDSTGASATVDLSQGNESTIQDVLDEINSRGLAILARVNDQGDGILLEDTGAGGTALRVEESGGSTARDLGILGEAASPGADLDGSFEKTVTLTATDTLQDLVDKINDADLNVAASVINDGSSVNPFRLSLNSLVAGRAGKFVFDDAGLGLGVQTLTKAQDARVFFGSTDPAKAIAVSSATNRLADLIPGATVNLLSASDSPVTLTVNRDDTGVIDSVKDFVDGFNSVIDSFDQYDFYNSDTEERGLLLGDPTIARARSSLYRLVIGRNNDLTGAYRSFSQVGITVVGDGKLSFDQTKFSKALETDPEAVEALFTFKETETDPDTNTQVTVKAGIGVRLDELLADLTDTTVQGKLDLLDGQINANTKRIEQYDEQLARKREILEQQFVQMELVLAELQSQSGSLNTLASLAAQSQSA